METQLQNLKSLLIKYFENGCSDSEKAELYEYLVHPDYANFAKDILLEQLSAFSEPAGQINEANFDKLYQKILFEISQNEEKENEKVRMFKKVRLRMVFKQSLRAAAIFVLAFALGAVYVNYQKSARLANLPNGGLCEISAPFGAKSDITLPDGSQVQLNAGSVIRYSSDFNVCNRNVSIEGEAYFKVAKNKELPLIVSADNVKIRAVGTEFNVKAYKDEGTVETTLIEGKVEITKTSKNEAQTTKLNLDVNQKAVFIKENSEASVENIRNREKELKSEAKVVDERTLVVEKIDIKQITAWTSNQMIFRGEKLENICIKLSRRYNVNFQFESEAVRNYRFSGTLNDETLTQVLDVIKLIAPIDYSMDKKMVLLKSNRSQANKYLEHLKN
jgi:transmembrane sensor